MSNLVKKQRKKKLYAFDWKGINAKGTALKGQLIAYNEQDAKQALIEQHLQITKIKQRNISAWAMRKNSANSADITLFSRQMATMLDAGVSLTESLKLLRSSSEKSELKLIVNQILTHIEAGSTLSQAMRNSSPLFDQFYCDLVATGEQTGRMDKVFRRITTYREKSENTRAKVIKAMIYPIIVVLVALAVSIGMLLFVIPTFKDIFSSFGAELPWFTLQVLGLSDFVQNNGVHLGLAGLILFLLSRFFYKRSYYVQYKTSHMLLKLPIVGAIVTKATLARFTRTLATTFSSGIPLLTGLTSAAKTANNLYYQEIINDVQLQTAGGRPLHQSIKEAGKFPDMMTQMVMIGEESGSLDDMLNKVAAIYEHDVDNTVDNLGKVLEPMIIVFLGLLIGALVIAMYLPMFNLMSVIG